MAAPGACTPCPTLGCLGSLEAPAMLLVLRFDMMLCVFELTPATGACPRRRQTLSTYIKTLNVDVLIMKT